MTGDMSQLFRQELDLAKTEIKEQVAQAGKGAGMLSGAGIAGMFGLLLLSFAAAWGLAEVVEPGVAFAIVGAVHVIAAAMLFASGKKALSSVDPVLHKTIETLKEDGQWARDQIK